MASDHRYDVHLFVGVQGVRSPATLSKNKELFDDFGTSYPSISHGSVSKTWPRKLSVHDRVLVEHRYLHDEHARTR